MYFTYTLCHVLSFFLATGSLHQLPVPLFIHYCGVTTNDGFYVEEHCAYVQNQCHRVPLPDAPRIIPLTYSLTLSRTSSLL